MAEPSLQERLGALIELGLLKTLDELYPNRLPPPGTPLDVVRDRMVERAVVDRMWAAFEATQSGLEQALPED